MLIKKLILITVYTIINIIILESSGYMKNIKLKYILITLITLFIIVAVSYKTVLLNKVSFAAGPGGQVYVYDVNKQWVYSDGSLIPEDELNALIEQGVIPSSIDIYYMLTASDNSQKGYESADGRQLACFYFDPGICSRSKPDMKLPNEVGLEDIGGWSKQTLSNENNWTIRFADDASDTVFGEYTRSFNLNLNPSTTYNYIPIDEFLPSGYPLITYFEKIYDDASHLYIYVNKYSGEKPYKSISVTKHWNGYSKDEIPDSIMVSLLNSDGIPVKTIDVTKNNGWIGTFENLPTYADGELIDYSGYSVSEDFNTANNIVNITGSAADGFTITNKDDSYGNLTVKKIVIGEGIDSNKEFNFTVELDDKTINGAYGDITFINGVASFALKDGKSVTATDIPTGISYSVIEDDYTADGYVTVKSGEKGIIDEKTPAVASFTNMKGDYGNLVVKKTVKGNADNMTKGFNFTVILSDKTINGNYGNINFTNGVATFNIKDGESITISGLPAGITYTVTENENDGYEVNAKGDKGKIVTNTTSTATFINEKSSVSKTDDKGPKTGISSNISIFILALGTIASFAGAYTYVCVKRKQYN